eukprot:192877-Chlamydomonas_euryale.AAC.2
MSDDLEKLGTAMFDGKVWERVGGWACGIDPVEESRAATWRSWVLACLAERCGRGLEAGRAFQ